MRILTSVFGLAAVAVAGTLPTGAMAAGGLDQGARKAPARVVLVCGADAATRRAFMREHGAPPVFVTAREALSVRPTDPAWQAPRCMTARQHVRYREAVSTYARVR